MPNRRTLALVSLLTALSAACGDDAAPEDAGQTMDASGPDARVDAGTDAGTDAAVDAGETDAGGDAGGMDAEGPDVDPGNRAPLAEAGPDRDDWVNRTISLDGTQSSDPDNDPLTFAWQQVSGASVPLTNADQAIATFDTATPGDYEFSLTVSDGTLTATDTVTLSVDAYGGGRVNITRNPLQYNVNLNSAYGMTNVGTQIYVADGSAGLKIFDVSDPRNMRQIGARNTPGTSFDVDVAGSYAFVADGNNGLVICDVADFINNVANPPAPVIVDTATTSYGAWGIEVVGNYAFVADGGVNAGTTGGGLLIFDVADYVAGVANPAPARIVGFAQTPGNAIAVDVHGTNAFIADRGINPGGSLSGVRVIDVADFVGGVAMPNPPAIIGDWPTSGANIFNVLATDDYVYVSDYGSNLEAIDGALRLLDVSDPTNPTEIAAAATDTMGSPNGLALSGDHLFISTPYNLEVLDVTDFVAGTANPASPVSVKIYGSPSINLQDVVVIGDYAFTISSAGAELSAVNISDLSADPSLLGTYRESNATSSQSAFTAVALTGSYALVGQSRTASLQVMDVSDPANPAPVLVSPVDIGDLVSHIAISGDYAYLSAATVGFVVADISDIVAGASNPAAPTVVGSFDLPGFDSPQHFLIAGDHAHVPWGGAGYQILDLTDPISPVAPTGGTAGLYDIASVAFDVAVQSDIAYLAHGAESLQIVDVMDPASPTLMGTLTAPDATSVEVDGDRVYVAGQRFVVGDVSAPTAPTELGRINTRLGFLVMDGGRLFANRGGPVEIDVSNPAFPYLKSGYTLQNSGGDFVRENGLVYACDGQAGFHVLRTFDDAHLSAPTSGAADATVSATLSWPTEIKDTLVDCLVSGGTCSVTSIDRSTNTATIEWVLPSALGDYELLGVVGDYNQWLSDRGQLRIR